MDVANSPEEKLVGGEDGGLATAHKDLRELARDGRGELSAGWNRNARRPESGIHARSF
jgi:hypothetical protein